MPSYHILIVDNMLSVEVPVSRPIPEKSQTGGRLDERGEGDVRTWEQPGERLGRGRDMRSDQAVQRVT